MAEKKTTSAVTEVKAVEMEIELKEIPVETLSPERAVESLYSNSTAFVATPFDLRFIFGQIRPAPNGKLVNEQHLSIVMSWEHTKALLDALKKTVEDHEKDFAPLSYKKRSEAG